MRRRARICRLFPGGPEWVLYFELICVNIRVYEQKTGRLRSARNAPDDAAMTESGEGVIMISVIVPVYNLKELVVRCVESILAQEYTDLEIIIVDDGSKDESPVLCDEETPAWRSAPASTSASSTATTTSPRICTASW